MDFALGYLANRFFYRLFDFFHHWYFGGSRTLAHRFMSLLEGLDRAFAVRITLRHFFEPLYKDYTFVGRLWGILFRTLRVAVGSVVYLAIAALFLVLYVIWLLIPPAIILYAFRGL